ncbi:HNH endonuclease [Streptococcus chenjunshii]|uniref:Putative HNH nuclease YajD n=1 Tax=Streptococcus chenjunshii TaxID=2173853 RepID=A0A372KLS9_9STRE|nr:HNH endonuclease [Streptococcus chenjunshii]AXQ79776.1 HNH endonuclease [Streptococcus chenjunshii]RFU51139.1 HNH endonuclease [Streptococcus chenjunshii]RFU53237.1 HNH endonuclease [Streptococcus chenjunshii]
MHIDTSTAESRHQFYQSTAWKRLRQRALERDHYECLWCKREGRVTASALEVDHVAELEHHPDKALELENLRTLCKYHHNMRHERFQFKRTKEKEPKTYREDEWFG